MSTLSIIFSIIIFNNQAKMLNRIANLIPKSSNNSLTWISLHRIFVESFPTPNPNFLKFVPQNRTVLGKEGTLDISDVKFAEISPLAQELFKVQGVTRVFYGSDYISISKSEPSTW